MRAGSASSLARPFRQDSQASRLWPSATPTFRSTVESERSRCQRDTGNFSEKWRKIAVAVEEHRVRARDRVELLGEAVVRLDLGGVGIEFQPERFDERPGKTLPVEIRVH